MDTSEIISAIDMLPSDYREYFDGVYELIRRIPATQLIDVERRLGLELTTSTVIQRKHLLALGFLASMRGTLESGTINTLIAVGASTTVALEDRAESRLSLLFHELWHLKPDDYKRILDSAVKWQIECAGFSYPVLEEAIRESIKYLEERVSVFNRLQSGEFVIDPNFAVAELQQHAGVEGFSEDVSPDAAYMVAYLAISPLPKMLRTKDAVPKRVEVRSCFRDYAGTSWLVQTNWVFEDARTMRFVGLDYLSDIFDNWN